jgi:hypothetical protein
LRKDALQNIAKELEVVRPDTTGEMPCFFCIFGYET